MPPSRSYPSSSLPITPRTRFRLLWVFGLSLGIVLCIYGFWQHYQKVQAASMRTQELRLAVQSERATNSFSASAASLQAAASGIQLSVSVATDHMSLHDFGGTQNFDAASTAKLISAAAYLHLVDTSQASLSQQLQGQSAIYWLRLMLINSDDTAWAVLNDDMGHPYLQRFAQSVGMTSYDPDSNTVSAHYLALLLQKLTENQLLSTKHWTLLQSLLQQANYRDYIVAATPPGMTVAHKVGFTDGNLHDVALIRRGGHWLILSIFTDNSGVYDINQQGQLIRDLTTAAIHAYLSS